LNGYLLDTNVPSEFRRERPEPAVVQWLKRQPATMLFLSAVTIGEIRKGLVMMPQGRRRTELEAWFHTDLLVWFRDRILPVTQSVGDRWGVLDGQCQLRGASLNTAEQVFGIPETVQGFVWGRGRPGTHRPSNRGASHLETASRRRAAAAMFLYDSGQGA
jgi:predicted nucleic acid-binding protein